MILSNKGKAHFALRYLADNGPSELKTIQDARAKGGQRRKVAFLLTAMTDAGWLDDWRGLYSIRKLGLAALAHLDSGSDLHMDELVANVRIFGRAA